MSFKVESVASATLFFFSRSGQDFKKKKVFLSGAFLRGDCFAERLSVIFVGKFEVEAVASATLFSQTA